MLAGEESSRSSRVGVLCLAIDDEQSRAVRDGVLRVDCNGASHAAALEGVRDCARAWGRLTSGARQARCSRMRSMVLGALGGVAGWPVRAVSIATDVPNDAATCIERR